MAGIVHRVRKAALACVLAPALVLGGCGSGREPGPVRVVVSIAPLEGVARAVAPEGAEVTSVIPAGASPHGFQPRPSDVRGLERADLVVVVGMGIEGGLGRYVRALEDGGTPVVRFADAAGLDDHGHDHDHDHAHDCAEFDAHLWLDPALMLVLVDAVESHLAEAVAGTASDTPELRASVAARAEAERRAIRATDAAVASILAPFAGARIVTHHGAFARFCARYGIEVAAVLRPVEASEPLPGELAAVREAVASGTVGGAFTEPQFDGRELVRLAEEGGVAVGQLDPLGSGDWHGMMLANARELARVLGGG